MKNNLKRVGALLLVIFMIALVFLTLYLAITGSPYFMASLFSMLGFPLLLYAFIYIYKMMK